MKKKNLFKIFFSVIALFAFFGVGSSVEAAPTITYAVLNEEATGPSINYNSLPINYGVYNTSNFKVDLYPYAGAERVAMAPGVCMLPKATRPQVSDGSGIWSSNKLTRLGTPELQVLNNSNIEKYLYYGLNPTGCTRDIAKEVYTRRHGTSDISTETRVVLVHSAISYENLLGKPNFEDWHYGLNGTAQNDTIAFMEAAKAAPLPSNLNEKPDGPGYYVYRVGNDAAQSLGLIITFPGTVKVNKRTTPNGSGVSLANAEYTIYSDENCTTEATKDANGTKYEKLVTNAAGNTNNVTVRTNKKYWVKETKVPSDRFEKDETCYICDLMVSDTCEINSKDNYIDETPEYGNLTIKKVDENENPLIGAVFTVYKGACGTGEVVATLTPNNSKATRSTGYVLPLEQEYCVRETTTPANYTTAADQPFTLTAANNTYSVTLTFTNTQVVKGSVSVRKVDGDSQPLSGAKFAIYANKNCTGRAIRTITSGSDGVASASNMDPGEYCLKETEAPTGFKLNTDTIPFTITETQTNVELGDVVNTQVRGRLRIAKSIDPASGVKLDLTSNPNYSLSGAVFSVYKNSCNSESNLQTTVTIPDGRSYAYLEDLELGRYCIRETKAPKGYINAEEEITVDVQSASTVYVTFEDAPGLGTVNLIKSTTNKDIKDSDPEKYSLAGAEFEITNKDGIVVGILTVDADGHSNTLRDLPYGEYYANETKAPDSGAYKKIDNKDNKNIYPVVLDELHPNGTFYATDEYVPGKALVNKVPAEQPDGSCTLKGAEYAVCKDEDCREVVVTLITGEDGKTQTEELQPGVYYFQEQKAPECFEVNPEVQRITVASGKTVEVTSKEQLIPKNPKTGVDNPYLITITTVAIGGAGLYFLRRKNAFRQI